MLTAHHSITSGFKAKINGNHAHCYNLTTLKVIHIRLIDLFSDDTSQSSPVRTKERYRGRSLSIEGERWKDYILSKV